VNRYRRYHYVVVDLMSLSFGPSLEASEILYFLITYPHA